MTSKNDGMKHSLGEGTTWYAAKAPNQIKSATDNVGTFSTENDDIQMAIESPFVNKSTLPEGELPVLDSALITKYGNNEDYGAVIYTANYEYTVNYKGAGEYDIIEYHPIDKEIKNEINDRENKGSLGSYDRLSARDETSKGKHNSDSYDVAGEESNRDNAGLDKEASQGESQQAQSDVSGEEHQGESFLRIPTSDGTNRPRYEKFQVKGEYPQTWDSSEDWQIIVQEFKTKWGELYGFVDSRGDIYLDETVITVEHNKGFTDGLRINKN